MAKRKQVALSGAADDANRHLAGHFDSHVNGHTSGHLEQHLNSHLNGHLNGITNGVAKAGAPTNERTDINRWRLLDERGRQTWHYLNTDDDIKSWPQSHADRYFLGLPTVEYTRHCLCWLY